MLVNFLVEAVGSQADNIVLLLVSFVPHISDPVQLGFFKKLGPTVFSCPFELIWRKL
jgi:hypothetical protein